MTVTASAEARREHILDAAEACFVRNGFHRATMQDLADTPDRAALRDVLDDLQACRALLDALRRPYDRDV